MGFGDYVLFVFNFIGMLGSIWILGWLLVDVLVGDDGLFMLVDVIVVVVVLIVVNIFVLLFVGMEYVLYVFVSFVILKGLIDLFEKGVGIGLIIGIIVVFFFRFEGFVFFGVVLFVLLLWGYWIRFIVIGVIIVVVLGVYVVIMFSLGLLVLFSLVMVKFIVLVVVVGIDMGGVFFVIIGNL